jgi:hypothetical protein
MNPSKLRRDALNHSLLGFSWHVPSSTRADLTKSVPFIHAKLTNAHFHVKTVVGIDTDISFSKMLAHHVLVDLLAALDFGDQLPTGLSKLAQEAFIPHLWIWVRVLRPSASTDTNKDTHFTTGPFVHHRFVQGFWTRVESAHAIIMEDWLPDGDRLESKSNRTSGSASLPNFAIKLRRGFFPGIVGS